MDERLKEIQELEGYGGIGGYAVYFENKKQFEWLKEQAESYEKMKKEFAEDMDFKRKEVKELEKSVVGWAKQYEELQEENQRYKDALEKITKENSLYFMDKIARQALKEDSHG